MGSKRKSEFGSVRKLPSKRWQARYTVGGSDRKAPSTFTTEDEALDWLKELGEAERSGRWDSRAGGEGLFSDWAERYIALPRRRRKKTANGATSRKAAATVSDYRNILDRHVIPFFGDMPIEQISFDTVINFQDHIENKLEGKDRTNEKAQNYARWVLSLAVKLGAIRFNPYAHPEIVMPDGSLRREPVPLEENDIDCLSLLILPHYRLVPMFTAYTGLRSGEVWALRRRSVNPLKHELEVSASVGEVKGQGLVMGPPKNGRTRWITLPDFLFEMVMEHMDATGGGPDDWLFRSVKGMQVRHSNFMEDVFKPVKNTLDDEGNRLFSARTRFHDLRHFCAHFHISAGHDLYDIMELLGHSSPDVTYKIYGGRFDKRRRELASQVDALYRANRASRASSVPDEVARLAKVASIEVGKSDPIWHDTGTERVANSG